MSKFLLILRRFNTNRIVFLCLAVLTTIGFLSSICAAADVGECVLKSIYKDGFQLYKKSDSVEVPYLEKDATPQGDALRVILPLIKGKEYPIAVQRDVIYTRYWPSYDNSSPQDFSFTVEANDFKLNLAVNKIRPRSIQNAIKEALQVPLNEKSYLDIKGRRAIEAGLKKSGLSQAESAKIFDSVISNLLSMDQESLLLSVATVDALEMKSIDDPEKATELACLCFLHFWHGGVCGDAISFFNTDFGKVYAWPFAGDKKLHTFHLYAFDGSGKLLFVGSYSANKASKLQGQGLPLLRWMLVSGKVDDIKPVAEHFLKNRGTGVHYYELLDFDSKAGQYELKTEISEKQVAGEKGEYVYCKVIYGEDQKPLRVESYELRSITEKWQFIYDSQGKLNKVIYTDEDGKIDEITKW